MMSQYLRCGTAMRLLAYAATVISIFGGPQPQRLHADLYSVGQTIGTATSGGAISTAAADLNLDGVPELVTVASSSSPDPHFRIHQYDPAEGWEHFDILSSVEVDQNRPNRFGGDSFIVDINGDSFLDILLPQSFNGAGPGKVLWYENPATNQLEGDWTEHTASVWDGGVGPDRPVHMSELEAGDLDGDGDIDIVTRDVKWGVYVLENQGDESFIRHFVSANPREGLDLFDPDRDGDLDIVLNGVWLEAPDPGNGPNELPNLADTDNFTFHPIADNGEEASPWYPESNTSSSQSDYASKVLAVDVNGDGSQDIVINNSEELSNDSIAVKPKGLAVYLADGMGGLSWTSNYPLVTGRSLHTLDAADVDNDGDIDLVTGVSTVGQGNESPEIILLLNDGTGENWQEIVIDQQYIYSGIFVDFDGDGDSDIVGPDNWNSGSLRVYESTSNDHLHGSPADFNGDGLINSLDLDFWRNTYGQTVTEDPNADGSGNSIVDGQDFLIWQRGLPETNPATTIPEPITIYLLSSTAITTLAALRSQSRAAVL